MSVGSPSLYQAARRSRLTRGKNMEKTCLPVHSGRGLRMAGIGTVGWGVLGQGAGVGGKARRVAARSHPAALCPQLAPPDSLRPSQSSSHISTFMRMSFSRKVSRLVKRRHPSSESCTMPITGLLAWGLTMFCGTAMISLTSARVSCDCGGVGGRWRWGRGTHGSGRPGPHVPSELLGLRPDAPAPGACSSRRRQSRRCKAR